MSLSFNCKKTIYVKHDNKTSLPIMQIQGCHDKKPQVKIRGAAWCACHKAALTVEAAAVLPFFVCFLVFILYFFRILQVQAGVAQALQYAGRKYAAQCGVRDSDMDLDNGIMIANLAKAKLIFQQQLKKQYCPIQYIENGMAGISLLQSDLSGNYVELKAVYRMGLPVRLLGDIQYRIVQGAKCRKWTGYQLGQDMQEEDTWLYYTEHGTVYHTSRECTHLDLSIQGVPFAQVAIRRNKGGGKYHKCEKCDSQAYGNNMVYITDYGDRYHTGLTCSGLKRNIYMIRKAKAFGKRMCSKCGDG